MDKTHPINLAYSTREKSNLNQKSKLHSSFSSWGSTQAQYLLMRTGFGASREEILQALVLSKADMINILFEDKPLPDPPGDWVTEPYILRGLSLEEKQKKQRQNGVNISNLNTWWIDQMISHGITESGRKNLSFLREKMTLFWHGHFVVERTTVKVAQYLYIYNDTLRRNALGNFRTFVKEMCKDPAMLIYLNGLENDTRHPNENFARELLELFTMGIDNYTELDVKEASRAFTGWQINQEILKTYYLPNRHDDGTKTFLGQTGNFDGDDIVDIIFEQDVTAIFICRKLYKFLVSPDVVDERVETLADIFRTHDYEIKPVLRAIFESDYFYDEENVGAIIKSPAQFVFSLVRHFSALEANRTYIYNSLHVLGQALFLPPNVAGWPGQRNWISPITLPTRGEFGETALNGGRIDRPNANSRNNLVGVDVMTFARSFSEERPRQLLDLWIEHLLPIRTDDTARDLLLDILLDGATEEDWSLNYEGVETRVSRCLVQILRLPEYQLL